MEVGGAASIWGVDSRKARGIPQGRRRSLSFGGVRSRKARGIPQGRRRSLSLGGSVHGKPEAFRKGRGAASILGGSVHGKPEAFRKGRGKASKKSSAFAQGRRRSLGGPIEELKALPSPLRKASGFPDTCQPTCGYAANIVSPGAPQDLINIHTQRFILKRFPYPDPGA
jgi:hypothetical protein